MEIEEYKCPNCAGAVSFDSSTQKMKCPYCGAEFETAALMDYQKDLALPDTDDFRWAERRDTPWEGAELDELAAGSCPSCGAGLIGGKNTVAMVCPNCGNNQIIKQRVEGALRPDCLIPFKLDKKAAVAALKAFYKGKRLLPKLFREENRVNSIQGVYIPFWLFDAEARGRVRYRATKVRTWSDGDSDYTKTDFYSVVRDGGIGFEKVPVDGSEKMADNYMDAIEPFGYDQLNDFGTAYLAGYLAEKYDVDANQSRERAAARMKASLETEFARSVVGYTSISRESSRVSVEDGRTRYALLPVWILNTTYRNKNYLFMMNGQTGRLVGSLPVDAGKSWKYRLIFTLIFGLVFTGIVQALRLFL